MSITYYNVEQQIEDAFYGLLDGNVEDYPIYRAHKDNVPEIDKNGVLIVCENGETRNIYGNWNVSVKILVFTDSTDDLTKHLKAVSDVREIIFNDNLAEELSAINSAIIFVGIIDFSFQNIIENNVRTAVNTVSMIVGQKTFQS